MARHLDSFHTVIILSGGYVHCQRPRWSSQVQDTNVYLLDRIGSHNVVTASLPAEKTGKVSAAIVAKDLLRSFKAVRFGLMVGVGSGALYYNVKHDNSAMDMDC